jgi:hypothetical protein
VYVRCLPPPILQRHAAKRFPSPPKVICVACVGDVITHPVCSPTPSSIANWMATPASSCSHQKHEGNSALPGRGNGAPENPWRFRDGLPLALDQAYDYSKSWNRHKPAVFLRVEGLDNFSVLYSA